MLPHHHVMEFQKYPTKENEKLIVNIHTQNQKFM